MAPDTGTVRLFGTSTTAIADYEGWLAMLDGLGLLPNAPCCSASARWRRTWPAAHAPDRSDSRRDAAPGRGLGRRSRYRRGAARPAGQRHRGRGRAARAPGAALALDPRLLVAEHPSAPLPRDAVAGFARELAAIASRRGLGVLAISADKDFVRALGGTALTLDPATGVLAKPGLLARLGLG